MQPIEYQITLTVLSDYPLTDHSKHNHIQSMPLVQDFWLQMHIHVQVLIVHLYLTIISKQEIQEYYLQMN